MKCEQASKLYKDNWDLEYTNMENLYKCIETLAKNGAYNMCVYIDSKSL
jgi:hypothetical protein